MKNDVLLRYIFTPDHGIWYIWYKKKIHDHNIVALNDPLSLHYQSASNWLPLFQFDLFF